MADYYLPNEIWCKIFSYLPLTPKKNATATCKLWWRLIREDQKLSASISISWYEIFALEKLRWNWNNWPVLKTLELNKFRYLNIEDSQEAIQNVIEKLSLKDCPPSLEEVLFNFELTPLQKYDQKILQYLPHTDQIFGLGKELDSLQKWNEYERSMKVLKKLKMRGIRFAIGSNFEYITYTDHMYGLEKDFNRYAKEFYSSRV